MEDTRDFLCRNTVVQNQVGVESAGTQLIVCGQLTRRSTPCIFLRVFFFEFLFHLLEILPLREFFFELSEIPIPGLFHFRNKQLIFRGNSGKPSGIWHFAGYRGHRPFVTIMIVCRPH